MKKLGIDVTACFICSFIALFLLSTSAYAEDYGCIVLDRTGSMMTGYSGNPNQTRCEVALANVKIDVNSFFIKYPAGLMKVWTFADSAPTDLTGAYVGKASAMSVLNPLSPTGCTGLTPLADAICDAANDFPGGGGHTREMHVGSDGGENNSSGPCSGPDSQSEDIPYDYGSWQYKAWTTCTGRAIFNIRYWFDAAKSDGIDTETGKPRGKGGLSDEKFFQDMANETGGEYIANPNDGSEVPISRATLLVCFFLFGLVGIVSLRMYTSQNKTG